MTYSTELTSLLISWLSSSEVYSTSCNVVSLRFNSNYSSIAI